MKKIQRVKTRAESFCDFSCLKVPRTFLRFGFMLILLMAFETHAQDQNLHIYVCFGQSNMEGYPRFEAQDTTVDERLRVLAAVDCPDLGRTMGNWYPAKPPLCRCRTGLSPADYFGRTMLQSLPGNIKVGILNVSVGGAKIELFDKNNYQSYVASAPGWLQNMVRDYGGNPYGRLVEMALLAKKQGVIKGILMHQGESNTNDTLWPGKVKAVYENLLKDLGLNANEVPLLAGEVVHADQGGVCASMNKIIATLPSVIPTAHIISSQGCPDAADNLHFNAEGCRMFGARYAARMLQLQGLGKEKQTGTQ